MHINSHIYISMYVLFFFMLFIMAVLVRNIKTINIIKDLAPSYILERKGNNFCLSQKNLSK